MDIENRLIKVENDFKNLPSREFKDFNELEIEYCRLINEITNIRNYIVATPGVADENSLKVLKNEVADFTLLSDKFKPLLHLMDLYRMLVDKYKEQVKVLLEEKKYDQVINIYNQLYRFTNNYWYKKEIANIHFQIYKDNKTALNMFKELENVIGKNPEYWWQLSQIYEDEKNYYKQLVSMQKAIKLELGKEV